MKKAWTVLGIFLISQAIAYKVLPHDGKPFMFGDFVTITLLLVILSGGLYGVVKLANSEAKIFGNQRKQIKTLEPTTPPPPPPPSGGKPHVICISQYRKRIDWLRMLPDDEMLKTGEKVRSRVICKDCAYYRRECEYCSVGHMDWWHEVVTLEQFREDVGLE